MIEFINFKAYPNPLGGEIDISYDYSEKITDNCKTYIFKSDNEINDEDIVAFLDDKNTNPGNLEISLIQNYLKKAWDYKVKQGKTYSYKGIIERKTVGENDTVITERSQIVTAKVDKIISEAIIHTVPMKQLVMNGMEKLVKAIVENVSARNTDQPTVELSVYDHYPVISEPTQFFVVTRASSDEGMKFWSNVFYEDKDKLIKGDIEAETINVTWMTVNNSIMRDQITNIMRGVRFWLRKYLMRQFETGVLGIHITLMADGDENPGNEMHLFFSGMLIHFLIETKLTIEKPSSLAENIRLEWGFDVEKNG